MYSARPPTNKRTWDQLFSNRLRIAPHVPSEWIWSFCVPLPSEGAEFVISVLLSLSSVACSVASGDEPTMNGKVCFLIHRNPWKVNSPKFACRIVHKPSLRAARMAADGHVRVRVRCARGGEERAERGDTWSSTGTGLQT